MLSDNPSVNILRELDTTGCWWCSSAVIFSVRNGKNTIGTICGSGDENYEYSSQMLINGKPLVQARLPECPTCKGMLAAGYGIENVDCPELKAARECMNSGFINIKDSAEKIKPLLGLLRDGYYVLADTLCLPSNGEGGFFYDVSGDLKYYDSVCDEYYCNWNFKSIRHFPLFLYPTQSSSLINDDRVEYYTQLLKSEKEPPRVLAYNYEGFMNLILDGHHKACAAASLGQYVRCLTIIRADGCRVSQEQLKRGRDLRQINPDIMTVYFAGIETEAEPGMCYLDIYGDGKKEEHPVQKFDLIEKPVHYGPDKYPAIKDIMFLMNPGGNIKGSLPETDDAALRTLLDENTDEADSYLEAVISYLALTDHDKAYKLAADILRKGDDCNKHGRVRSALLFLLDNRSDETEQILADFYVAHEEQDELKDLVDSYWKNKAE